ncbi:MAG: TerB family tellurite resistance protein [Candidatus Delongbacteria bacterium]|nr:TerB family tellurite resistance protein [Candidatus Delongbacteria bacterium]MCG2760288.1 TerB family tellurite resistance protein [Candidatus Delongbacteria bacterium]
MSLKGTLLGAAAGFFMGGPIGALIGGILGNMISGSDRRTKPVQPENIKDERTEFTISLLVLFAAVIRADRITKKSEVIFVKDYLIKTFGPENASDMMQLLKGLLEKDIDLVKVCGQIRQSSSYSFRLELVHLLFKLATADDELVTEEVNTIAQITSLLGVYSIDFSRLFAMFAGYHRRESRSYDRQERESSYRKVDPLKNAYEILGLNKSATKEEVKSAFRTLSKKYHPDRVTHLGPEFVKVANEKFIKVKEAYDAITGENMRSE